MVTRVAVLLAFCGRLDRASSVYDGMDDEFLLDERPVFPDDNPLSAAAAPIPSVGSSGLVSPVVHSYLNGFRGMAGVSAGYASPVAESVTAGSLPVGIGQTSGLGSYPSGLFSLIQQNSNPVTAAAYPAGVSGSFTAQPATQFRFAQSQFPSSTTQSKPLPPSGVGAPRISGRSDFDQNRKIAQLLHRKQKRLMAQEKRLEREASLFEDVVPEQEALAHKNDDLMRLRARQKWLGTHSKHFSTEDIERDQLRDRVKAQKSALEEASNKAAEVALMVDPIHAKYLQTGADLDPKTISTDQMRLLQRQNVNLLNKLTEATGQNVGDAAKTLTECANCGEDVIKSKSVSLIEPPPPPPDDPLDEPLTELKDDIVNTALRVKEEGEWLKKVNAVLEKYSKKAKNVSANVIKLKQNLRDLLKKKRQVQNLKLQHQLEEKVKQAATDLVTLETAVGKVNQKEQSFQKTRTTLKETVKELEESLLRLQSPAQKAAGKGESEAIGEQALLDITSSIRGKRDPPGKNFNVLQPV